MRVLLILAAVFLAVPAHADWQYEPPPLDAIVTYSDGHTSRIAAAEGDQIILLDDEGHGPVVEEYRTWLLRIRRADPELSGEITIEVDQPEEVLALWPLQEGLSSRYGFSTYINGELSSRGSLELSYRGVETLELPAGVFEAHKLIRDASITRQEDGREVRLFTATWHDAATGLILRQDWRIALPDADLQSGSFVATSVELK